jgi:hypothetical protein
LQLAVGIVPEIYGYFEISFEFTVKAITDINEPGGYVPMFQW